MKNYHTIDGIQRLEKIKTIKVRRVSKNRRDMKKKKREKFGIEIPRNVRHTLLLDTENKKIMGRSYHKRDGSIR